MEIKKRYEWRKLTDDGLLVKPEDVGPYYERRNVNSSLGFDSEEEAIEEYKKFAHYHYPELVLVTLYVQI